MTNAQRAAFRALCDTGSLIVPLARWAVSDIVDEPETHDEWSRKTMDFESALAKARELLGE